MNASECYLRLRLDAGLSGDSSDLTVRAGLEVVIFLGRINQKFGRWKGSDSMSARHFH